MPHSNVPPVARVEFKTKSVAETTSSPHFVVGPSVQDLPIETATESILNTPRGGSESVLSTKKAETVGGIASS